MLKILYFLKYLKLYIIYLVSLYFFSFILFIVFLPTSNLNDFKKNPQQINNIIVYTGGSNRINVGLDLYRINLENKLFITGVNSNIDKKLFISSLNLNENKIKCCVHIDQNATSTIENIKTTQEWLNKHPISNPIIVTSSYHLPRVQLLLNFSNLNTRCFAVLSYKKLFKINVLKILLIEYTKYIFIIIKNIKHLHKFQWPNCNNVFIKHQ